MRTKQDIDKDYSAYCLAIGDNLVKKNHFLDFAEKNENIIKELVVKCLDLIKESHELDKKPTEASLPQDPQ